MDNVIFFIEAWICGLEKITEPQGDNHTGSCCFAPPFWSPVFLFVTPFPLCFLYIFRINITKFFEKSNFFICVLLLFPTVSTAFSGFCINSFSRFPLTYDAFWNCRNGSKNRIFVQKYICPLETSLPKKRFMVSISSFSASCSSTV